MTPAGALALVQTLARHARWQRTRTPDEWAAEVDEALDLLPDASDEWVTTWVRGELRETRVPTVVDVVAAWRDHERPRASEAALAAIESVPSAPPEVEADGARWVAWERARRSALVAGASPDDAVVAADRAVGVLERAPEPVLDVATARARVREVLAEVARTRVLTLPEDGEE